MADIYCQVLDIRNVIRHARRPANPVHRTLAWRLGPFTFLPIFKKLGLSCFFFDAARLLECDHGVCLVQAAGTNDEPDADLPGRQAAPKAVTSAPAGRWSERNRSGN